MGEWRKLTEPGSGRWAKAPALAAAEVLDIIIRSALLAAERKRVRTLRETTEAEYDALINASTLVFGRYLARAGLDKETFDRLAPRSTDSFNLASAYAMSDIIEDLVIMGQYDLVDIDDLPRPAVREGGGAKSRAEARTFEVYLATFVERLCGRPFHAFVLWLSGELFPDAPPGDKTTLARYRGWERGEREVEAAAKARQDREQAARWEEIAAMPEPAEDPFFGLSENSALVSGRARDRPSKAGRSGTARAPCAALLPWLHQQHHPLSLICHTSRVPLITRSGPRSMTPAQVPLLWRKSAGS